VPTRAKRDSTIAFADLANLISTDRKDALDALVDAGIDYVKEGNAHLYPLFTGVKVLIDRKEGIGLKASELNQQAQAKLNDVRRKALERELVPIAEARQLAASMAAMVSQTVEDSELTMEQQNILMQRMENAAREAFGDDT
jgi:hypothetical protein